MPTKPRLTALLAAALVLAGAALHAQGKASGPRSRVSFALTYDTLGSNLTNTNRFWMQGGAAELNGNFFHGFGATASVLGLHTANSGGGVPVNLVTAAFGPSYTWHSRGARPVSLFARGLAGDANGFQGLYPHSGGSISSANSLAVLAGGGVDLGLSRHVALRLVQADYLRTQLPNSFTNVQNSLRLGAGIVLR